MSVKLEHVTDSNVFSVELSGKLTKEDYERFVPEFERAIEEHGKIRIMTHVHDFHGWDMGALWEDIKFDLKHFNHIERIAMVGESKWEKGMAIFCKPFTSAKIKYFEMAEADLAREWIFEDVPLPTLSDADASDLVRVYTLHDSGLAGIICNALRAEGIPCFVADELQASLTGIFEVDILVRASDADRARTFITNHEESHKVTI
jgi:hypothetical protein